MTVKDLEEFMMLGIEIDSLNESAEDTRQYSWNNAAMEYIEHVESIILNRKTRRQMIIDRVNSLSDPLLQRILSERYFFGKTLDEISKSIGYSYHYTSRIFKAAIEEFEE
jgi:DNA-directed RNA polymerase specialized sigma subunit